MYAADQRVLEADFDSKDALASRFAKNSHFPPYGPSDKSAYVSAYNCWNPVQLVRVVMSRKFGEAYQW